MRAELKKAGPTPHKRFSILKQLHENALGLRLLWRIGYAATMKTTVTKLSKGNLSLTKIVILTYLKRDFCEKKTVFVF